MQRSDVGRQGIEAQWRPRKVLGGSSARSGLGAGWGSVSNVHGPTQPAGVGLFRCGHAYAPAAWGAADRAAMISAAVCWMRLSEAASVSAAFSSGPA